MRRSPVAIGGAYSSVAERLKLHGTIFINYRRADDKSFAHRLFDRLRQNFAPDEPFFDVDSMEPGLDFVEVLDQQVAQCDVFLAVIGKDWLHSTDDAGHRRLDDPNDFVRIEIESALRRNIRLIPVLVDDAQIPRADDLPESLKPLARRHAVRLANERFHPDSERLIRALDAALTEAAEKREQQARESEARERKHAEAEARRKFAEEERQREAREREQAEEEAERERQAARARHDDAPGAAPRRRAVDRSVPESRWGGILGGVAVLAAVVAVVIVSMPNGTDISESQLPARTKAQTEPEPEPASETEAAPAQAEIENPLPSVEPSAGTAASQVGATLEPFRDCAECPEMVVIPADKFVMGLPADEEGLYEGPQREVTIPAFALGRYEVTFEEWDACVEAGGCSHKPEDLSGRGRQPVMRVSWEDAQEYVEWLSEKTGERYRLPSEAEWEYAARAGTTTAYAFGDEITENQPNSGRDLGKTTEVGSYPANVWGLHDMHGNVWEWVKDCWNESYEGAPTDGSAWLQGNCDRRVVRGGPWGGYPKYLRWAYRNSDEPGFRFFDIGFRVARALTP